LSFLEEFVPFFLAPWLVKGQMQL